MLTMFDDDSVFAAVRAGALGYVLKGNDLEDILRAITSVAGQAVFGPGIARRALAFLGAPGA
jgi:DNA-binding NarL/FixJ family response regulator